MDAWHVIVAHRRRDARAELSLSVIGLGVYLPRAWQYSRTGAGWAWVERLQTPPYLYARFDAADAHQTSAVLHCNGVKAILAGAGSGPAVVPGEIIAAGRLRELRERAGWSSDPDKSGLTLGQTCWVVSGAMAGRVGVLVAMHGGRAWLDAGAVMLSLPVGEISNNGRK